MKKAIVIVAAVAVLIIAGVVVFHHHQLVIEAQKSTTGQQAAVGTTTPATTSTTNPIPAQPSVPTKGTMTIGESDHTMQYGGITRSYTVYLPKGYSSSQSYPLVVLIHGGDGSGNNFVSKLGSSSSEPPGKRFLASTGFEPKADNDHFIVVAPEGYQGNWNDGRTDTEPAKAGIDDVGFITTLVSQLETTYSINSKKVYATGMSNGGTMAYYLACAKPNVFAAVGGVSASTVKTVAATCTSAVPIVGIQGTADPFMTFDGSPSKFAKYTGADPNAPSEMLAAMDNMNLWVKNNSCNSTPTITHLPVIVNDGTSVDEYTFTGCSTPNAVNYYVVNGMGHSWPGGSSGYAALQKITGPSSGNLNATNVVWAFFSTHSK